MSHVVFIVKVELLAQELFIEAWKNRPNAYFRSLKRSYMAHSSLVLSLNLTQRSSSAGPGFFMTSDSEGQ